MKYPIQQTLVVVSSRGTGYLISCQSLCRKGLILFVKDFYYLLRGKIANPAMFGYSVAWFEDEITTLKLHRFPTRLKH